MARKNCFGNKTKAASGYHRFPDGSKCLGSCTVWKETTLDEQGRLMNNAYLTESHPEHIPIVLGASLFIAWTKVKTFRNNRAGKHMQLVSLYCNSSRIRMKPTKASSSNVRDGRMAWQNCFGSGNLQKQSYWHIQENSKIFTRRGINLHSIIAHFNWVQSNAKQPKDATEVVNSSATLDEMEINIIARCGQECSRDEGRPRKLSACNSHCNYRACLCNFRSWSWFNTFKNSFKLKTWKK